MRPSCVAVDSSAAADSPVARRTRAGPKTAERFGEPPVDEERFAIVTEHNVARFEVAVEHSTVVGIFNGVADINESTGAGGARVCPGRGLSR